MAITVCQIFYPINPRNLEYPQIFFGQNLAYLRKQKKLKQNEMNIHLNISRTTWSNYEQGKTTPTLDNLVRICQLFNVTMDELITINLAERPRYKKMRPYPTDFPETNNVVREDSFEYVVIKKISLLEDKMEEWENKHSKDE